MFPRVFTIFCFHGKLLLWIYPHNPTYGGVYSTTIFLKTKSQLPNHQNTLKLFFEIQ